MLKSLCNTSAKLINSSFSKQFSVRIQNKCHMQLKSVVDILEQFAPTSYAEKWDNVGLLIEPYKQRDIKKILLTNDLTLNVMQEACTKHIDMIISYHPPIFAPLKRITQSNWKERIVSMCLAESIALYSPHTAWDAVQGGVNDWLASALPAQDIKPIQQNPQQADGIGSGRIFCTPELTLQQAIERIQKLIGLDVHVAMAVGHNLQSTISRVALCAGSGGSLLKGLPADLYISGEMSHHEVLDAQHQGVSVILCNHSNSERGFLKEFSQKLSTWLNGECEVILSETDEDPLKTHVLRK